MYNWMNTVDQNRLSKYDLFSVAHEAGHNWYIRLGLNYTILNALKTALINSGTPKDNRFVCYMELLNRPDFWRFVAQGLSRSS